MSPACISNQTWSLSVVFLQPLELPDPQFQSRVGVIPEMQGPPQTTGELEGLIGDSWGLLGFLGVPRLLYKNDALHDLQSPSTDCLGHDCSASRRREQGVGRGFRACLLTEMFP